MKRWLFPLLVSASLFLASCVSSETAEEAPTSIQTVTTTESPSTSEESTTTQPMETTAPPQPPISQTVIDTPPATPPATSAEDPYADSVFNEPSVGYQCPGTDAYVDDPADCNSANLGGEAIYDEMYPGGLPADQVPIADGGTCPAYLCGYGTDENGNPNPSSGELQTLHGCDEGYITDEELCSAVRDKASQYGW